MKKGLLMNIMGNNSINFHLPTPFDNLMGKVVIYFSPVKLVFLLLKSALRGTIRCLVIFSMKTYVLPRSHNYIPVLIPIIYAEIMGIHRNYNLKDVWNVVL